MEIYFLILLIVVMAGALASGFPVAFALPGSAILTIAAAALAGWAFTGDSSAYFAQGGPVEWLNAGVTNFRGVYWEVERDTLIAIPLFVFMGIMLQRSKVAEDLLVAMAQLFGPVPGGLGISVVFVGALLAATTGIVGATVVAMGLISLPAMRRNRYSHSLATGTIAASGTLGQIIPPSIVLIILADQLSSAVDQASTLRKAAYKAATGEFSLPSWLDIGSTSAGEMFLGAFVPGLLLVGIYMAFILILALMRPRLAPAVPYEGRMDHRFWGRVLVILIPPLALIIMVLGSIISGIATVNQAGAIGAAGALIMAGYRLYHGKKGAYIPAILALTSLAVLSLILAIFDTNVKSIDTGDDVLGVGLAVLAVAGLLAGLIWSGWRVAVVDNTLRAVAIDTAKTTSLVFIILLGAAMLTAAFRAFGGEELVREFLTSLPGGFWVQFIIVMAVVFLLGFFLDFIEIAVVVVPIVAPILLMDPGANITAVWLGVMIGLNIQTSFLTPPFGFALFYLRGVSPAAVKTTEIYKGVIAFIALQLVALVIVGYYPPLVNYLPNRISLASETAPPPANPRLQQCLEEHLFVEYAANGSRLRQVIDRARGLELSLLPARHEKTLTKAIDQAGQVFGHLEAIERADAAIASAQTGYAELHHQVRRIERDIRRLDQETGLLGNALDMARRNGDTARATALEGELAALENEKQGLAMAIPENWPSERKAFSALKKAQSTARTRYRRLVDGAYEPVADLIADLRATPALAALRGDVAALDAAIRGGEPEDAAAKISAVSRQIKAASGAKPVRDALSKARRLIKGRKTDSAGAQEQLQKALAAFDKDIAWRLAALDGLLDGLAAYESEIRSTIGLRKQPRLPEALIPELAACLSHHRDRSLEF